MKFCTLMFVILLSSSANAWVRVVYVPQGDTMKFFYGNSNVMLPMILYGVDCPEKKQRFGKEAAKFTAMMVLGKKVDIVKYQSDAKGNVVAEVFVNGRSVNKALLEAGLAWYKRDIARKDFVEAENRARKLKRGLWKLGAPIPPWRWRIREKKRKKSN